MNTNTKIYVAAAIVGLIALGLIGGSIWSSGEIAKRERAVEAATAAAAASERTANQKELEAAGYREKIEYLEARLGEIQTIARKQDEELKKFSNSSSRARGDVERARRTRPVSSTAEELCTKLAELGYPCGGQ